MKRRFVESGGFSEDRRQLERARELSHDDLVALEQSILAVTHLLAIFGKREKTDLSPAERRQIAVLVKELKREEEKP